MQATIEIEESETKEALRIYIEGKGWRCGKVELSVIRGSQDPREPFEANWGRMRSLQLDNRPQLRRLMGIRHSI